MLVAFIGFLGLVLILIAFVLNEFHRINANSKSYDVLNAVGAVLLAYYAFALNSLPFVVLNVIWAAVSLRDLFFEGRSRGRPGYKASK